MLLDRDRQLLTAYVDGELTSRQRRHVVRLLHRSPEARQFLQQLKADSRALGDLPRPSLPVDFSAPVLRLIGERNLSPGRIRIVKFASPTPWMGPILSWAAAAAVLLILGVASYFYFVASMEKPANTELVQKQPEPSPSVSQEEDLEPPIISDDGNEKPSQRLAPKGERPSAVRPPRIVRQPDKKSKSSLVEKSQPSSKEETALTDRVETFQFERVRDLLPMIVTLGDVDRPPTRAKLLGDLRKDNTFRLELPCPNGSKALDRVQNAARRLNIGLIIDKPAQERIKLKWRISYALYMENLTPEELVQFLHQIEVEDHKKLGGKAAETQFERLVVTHMTAGHRKELTALLGTDPTPPASNTTSSSGSDSRTPLPDATARQIGPTLAGQGGTQRPEGGQQVTQVPERIALVLAYHPVRPSPGSEEIKHFLESRKPARAGTLRVLLVLRSGS
ncbi:MAG TPA: hypothetical protein VH592_18995 [Gemmataceae bacterium]|jgi:hypothetical protein